MATKFIINLNNGLKFTSYEKPIIENNRCSFKDREGLNKNFPISSTPPTPYDVISIEEVNA